MAARRKSASEPVLGDGPDTPEVLLSTIVDALGRAVLDVVRAPRGVDVHVADFVIYDAVDARPPELGDLVLAVGVDAATTPAINLVTGSSGAGAVVFKRTDLPIDELQEAADRAGVAILFAPRDMAWGQLHALLRTAKVAAGSPAHVGPQGSPIGDLFALANAVSSSVGGATTIEDIHSTVLAYSSTAEPIDDPRRDTILGRRVPDQWIRRLQEDGVFRRLWSEGFVEVDYSETEPGVLRRMAVAIRAGGEVLGSIWVTEGETPLGDREAAALSNAADIAALHLLRHRAGDDLVRRRRSEALRSLLDGHFAADAIAGALGAVGAKAFTMLAFELPLPDASEPADVAALTERAIHLISLQCESFRRQAALVADGRIVHVLLPDDVAPLPDRLAAFADDVVERLERSIHVPARAGIGPTVTRFDEIPSSSSGAVKALRVLAGRKDLKVATISDVRSHAVLLDLYDLAARYPALRDGAISVLIEHDERRGSNYVETLRAYLDAFGDVRAAATMMSVHPNTFRYRLKRLLELSAIDLDDPVERMIVHLQIALHGLPRDAD